MHIHNSIFTPLDCVRDKVIGSGVVVVVVDTITGSSQHLHTCSTCMSPNFTGSLGKLAPLSSNHFTTVCLMFTAIAVKEVLFVIGHFPSVPFILLYIASMLSIYTLMLSHILCGGGGGCALMSTLK